MRQPTMTAAKPKVLISDKMSPQAEAIFKSRGVEVTVKTDLKPEELAELMVWLLADSAARVTGQVWSLDGGFSSIRPLVK